MNLDEQIAKAKLEKRKQQEETKAVEQSIQREEIRNEIGLDNTDQVNNEEQLNNAAQSDKEEKMPTIEELKEAILTGKAEVKGRTYCFDILQLFGGKIILPAESKGLLEKVNEEKAFVYVDDSRGISITGNLITENSTKQPFDKFKAGMEEQFRQMGFNLEWMEEGEIEKGKNTINYGWFTTSTAKGNILNLIFYLEVKEGLVIGNINVFEQFSAVWKPILEACLQLMEIRE